MDTQLLAELVSHTPASGPSGVAERSSRFSWLPRQKRVIYFRVANRLVHHAAAGVSRFLQSSRASTAANIVEVLRRENAHALARNVKCIEWAPQLSILCVRVRSFLPAPASLSIERILSYGDHEKTCECFYARFFASSPPSCCRMFRNSLASTWLDFSTPFRTFTSEMLMDGLERNCDNLIWRCD